MSMIIKTTLRNIRDEYSSDESWEDNGGELEDFEELIKCEASGELVTIVAEAASGYFDVKLPSGKIVDALSVFHLSGFNDDHTNTINYMTLVS